MIIRSKAPLRISFGGGGTDVSPYPEERGGCVLCTTINKYTYASLVTHPGNSIGVHSLDYNIGAKYALSKETSYDGKLDLVKAAIKVMEIDEGLDLFLHSDAPPGSGVGSSSAITVALVGLFKHLRKLPLTDYNVANLAYRIEREELGIKGGRQDQYAATFGGFNFIEFFNDVTIVNPIRLNDDVLNELEYRLMLCYTEKRHLSASTIDDQVKRYVQRNEVVVRALEETKELAIRMKNALLLGQLNNFGALLHEAWCLKKRFSAQITTPRIDEFYEIARKNGAIGGKLLGAGGGGYLLLFCEFDERHKLADKLQLAGGELMSFNFELKGLQTWEVRGG